jgi:hypothetical protein
MSYFDDASLVMIPSGYKDQKVYSVKPIDGSGDLTFSRGSDIEATRVASNGYIEKAKVNLLLQSNTFSNASWSKVNVTATGGQAGYDGSNDAWLIEGTGSSVFSYLLQSDGTASVKTRSVYAKAGTVPYLGIWGAGSNLGYFDLSDGSLDSISGSFAITHSITSVGGGWYRCEFTTTGSAANVYLVPSSTANGTILSAGENIYIQDAQLNYGLVAQEYQETTTTTVVTGITNDMPRLDYSGGASCPSLLLEPSRTNVVEYSEYFDIYTKNNATITNNDSLSPEGLINAASIAGDGTTNSHYIYRNSGTAVSGTDYTISFFAKKGSLDYVQIVMGSTAFGVLHQNFDLANGTIGSSSGSVTPFIEAYTDNWYRVGITITATASATITPFIALANSSTMLRLASFATSSDIKIYGLQVEAGAYPASYIPTYGTSATRTVDAMNTTFSTAFDTSSGGTAFFYMSGIADGAAGDSQIPFRVRKDAGNYVGIGISGAAWRTRITTSSAGTITDISSISYTDDAKIAISWSSSGYSIYVNGASEDTNTTDISDIDEITDFFSSLNDNRGAHGMKQFILFPSKLTDAQLAELTTL